MKNLKTLGIIILIGLIIFFTVDTCTKEMKDVEVPVKIDVPVPSKKGSSDTIKNIEPISEINISDSINKELEKYNNKLLQENKRLRKQNKEYIEENEELLAEYKKSDSLEREEVYKEALTIREYEEVFKDSNQTISVYSKARGELLEQSVKYETEEYFIPLDTTVTNQIRQPFQIYGSLEIGTDIFSEDRFSTFVVKPGLEFKNSKNFSILLSGDTEGRGWLGSKIKF